MPLWPLSRWGCVFPHTKKVSGWTVYLQWEWYPKKVLRNNFTTLQDRKSLQSCFRVRIRTMYIRELTCQLTNESFLKADMRSALVRRGCSMNKFRQPFPSSTIVFHDACTLYLSHSDYLSNYKGTTLAFNRPMGQSNSGRSWTSMGSKSPRRGQGNPFLCRDLLLV